MQDRNTTPAGNLVDAENGIVSREIFVDRDIFAREQEQIFARAWLMIGHESLIPEPDDYFVSRMGTDSVILTRNKQGEIFVFLNSCMHRGMKLCRYDQGSAPVFTCPYHGWSYSTDRKRVDRPGALVGVPRYQECYEGVLDRSEWGLVRCPKVVNYKGTIWASWDPDAPSLEDYLGDMRLYLDAALDHRDGREGGSIVLGTVQKWRVKCNWKFAPENFIGDLYHDISHRSADLSGIGPSGGKGRRDAQRPRLAIGFTDLGHGVLGDLPHTAEPELLPTHQDDPELVAYHQQMHDDRSRNLGNRKRVTMSVGTIFPNMSFHARQPRTIAVAHPISATEMEMWRYYLIDADAPPKVKDAAMRYYLRYSGPAGMTESDDMENWTYASEATAGHISRRHHYNYQLSLGQERPVEGLRGAVESGSYSEGNARIFYRRWGQFMDAAGWADMTPEAATPERVDAD
ncbi:MAG: Rieske 2Fe-2S domain-containing protein [Alphaproteobacteria bacterium]|nr:Rieske 2Fe-2S domain-containing protein [Alphaproteobacteria bacterium]